MHVSYVCKWIELRNGLNACYIRNRIRFVCRVRQGRTVLLQLCHEKGAIFHPFSSIAPFDASKLVFENQYISVYLNGKTTLPKTSK